MTALIWAGVDPGITGALALIHPDGTPELHDMPTRAVPGKLRREIDAKRLSELLVEMTKTSGHVRCMIERIHARPDFALQTQGRMMETSGAIKAACDIAGWEISFVDPRAWKSFYGLHAEKAQSLEVARKLYPDAEPVLRLAKHHNRAEALLIAHFGLRRMEF